MPTHAPQPLQSRRRGGFSFPAPAARPAQQAAREPDKKPAASHGPPRRRAPAPRVPAPLVLPAPAAQVAPAHLDLPLTGGALASVAVPARAHTASIVSRWKLMP